MDPDISRFVWHRTFIACLFALAGICFTLVCGPAHAETSEIRIGGGFGIHYLPFYVMEHEQLFEKAAKSAGLNDVKASYPRFSGGGALNEAILSGAVDVVGAGIGPFSIIWDKTKGKLGMKAVAAMGDIPLVLLTNSPRIKTLDDIGEGDRIALPGVKASMQATLLQIAAAKTRGEANYAALDQYTVTLPHSEAVTSLLSTRGIVDCHFAVAPFSTRELLNPNVHKITDTPQIIGGPMSINLVFMSERFHQANPATVRAFVTALSDAMDLIKRDPALAARIYFDTDKGAATDVKMVEDILKDPAFNFTIVPHGVGIVTRFMHRTGILRNDPASWTDLFFPEAHALPGN